MIANGGLHDPEQAEAVLREGDGDLIALARGALANPDWPNRLRSGRAQENFDPAMLNPKASLGNADAWARGGAL